MMITIMEVIFPKPTILKVIGSYIFNGALKEGPGGQKYQLLYTIQKYIFAETIGSICVKYHSGFVLKIRNFLCSQITDVTFNALNVQFKRQTHY